ncbi:cytidylate kinase family protein [Trueperella bialowiezensis]|uniref:Glucuronide permease n=1 Tax=Trueperella bialowiezensis TaxID=312285 RepID=A0A3S4VGJ7_9ACTO|nr:cytidylate kinase family protein [Trueperella bialowiezensis]VEI13616.1 Glucuronide permease [Trueperella bialowiezensis]
MTDTKGAVASTRLSNGKVISYALGDVANNLTFMMTSMFLVVYMTDLAGISAGVAGAIYGVTKFWAGITDLTAGQTVDRFDTRWGRLRPWILFGSAPLAIVFVALFSVPAGIAGTTMAIVWILLFDAAYQLAYSFVNIPYGSLSSALTQDPVDRSRLSGARSIASSLSGVLLAFAVAPQFQDTAADGIRQKFMITTLILGAIAVILYLICFKNTKEVVERPQQKVTLRSTLKTVRANKPLLVLCSGAMFLLAGMFTMSAVALFYARDVLGNAGWYAFLQLAQTLGSIVIASAVPTITVRLGKRKGYMLGGAVTVLAFVIMYFAPGGSLVAGIIAWFVYGMGVGGTNALMFSMQADTVDYGEWKTGTRSEGGSYSILSFIRKVGQGIGGWAGAALIGAFGYNSQAAVQTEQAIEGIRIATGALPAVLTFIAILIMSRYPLGLEEHSQIVRELNERRTKKAVTEMAGMSEGEVKTTEVGDGRTMRLRKKGEAVPPIVTVFGQSGAGASVIGPMLARELAVPYVGQKFSSEELALVDREALVSDSGFDRWLRSVEHAGAQDSTMALGASEEQNFQVAAENTRNVLAEVANGGVVHGRNGAYVLHHAVGAIHVRLIAPKPKRIERIMHRWGLNPTEATAQLEAEDRLRAEMSRHLYQWDPNNDAYYDLVINTGSITYEQVVEAIAELYRSKYPENQPDPTVDTGEIPLPPYPAEAHREGSEEDVLK